VCREENRLIVYNGDLAGRVISVDADAWSPVDLQYVIEAGETLLNVQFPAAFKGFLIWLAAQDQKSLLEMIGLLTLEDSTQPKLEVMTPNLPRAWRCP
jgi:hypothetical protein